MQKLSRRKLAHYVANNVRGGFVSPSVLSEVAAYLVETGRQRELTLVVRAIEDVLAERGVVVASVTSAHPLTNDIRQQLIKKIAAKEVYLHETVDPALIGGVRLQTPSATLDTTIAHKLTLLKGAKQ